MRRIATVVGLAAVFLASLPWVGGAQAATLLRTIRTSQFSPPSPDPMGLGYNHATRRLIVVDSEVEETHRWRGANVFEVTLGGTLAATSSTTAFTPEPVGAAVNPTNGHVFIVDDDLDKVFEIVVGSDGKIGTSDDSRTWFSTRSFGSGDPEGIAFGGGSLWIADGVGTEVYRLSPGADGDFEGVGSGKDDRATHWDTSGLGQSDPEAIEYRASTNSVFVASRKVKSVAEVQTDGDLVRKIDLSFFTSKGFSGLAWAPRSTDSSKRSLYLTDRGVDNDSNPDENDGKIYEVAI